MAKFLLGNLKGPKGDKGDPGPRGPQGIQGPPGTAENIDLTPFVKKTEGATLTGQYTFTNNTPIKLNGYNIVSENIVFYLKMQIIIMYLLSMLIPSRITISLY